MCPHLNARQVETKVCVIKLEKSFKNKFSPSVIPNSLLWKAEQQRKFAFGARTCCGVGLLLLSCLFNHHVVKLKYNISSAFRCNSKWESFRIEDLRIWLSWVFFDLTTSSLWNLFFYHNNIFFFHNQVGSIKKRNPYYNWVML